MGSFVPVQGKLSLRSNPRHLLSMSSNLRVLSSQDLKIMFVFFIRHSLDSGNQDVSGIRLHQHSLQILVSQLQHSIHVYSMDTLDRILSSSAFTSMILSLLAPVW